MTVVATLQAFHTAVSAVTSGEIRRPMSDAELVGLLDEVGCSTLVDPTGASAAHSAFKAVFESTPPSDPMQLALWGQDYMAKRRDLWSHCALAVFENVALVEKQP
ncbi:MAG: hypothetical protein RJB26_414 [Pseudomonadota bacterium]|jgi:hypothetical protein